MPSRAGDPLWKRAALLVGLPAVLWYAVLVGTGMLISGPAAGVAAVGEEVVEGLEASRTPQWDDVTMWVSSSANTGTIVVGALVLGLLLRLVWKRWLPALLLWGGVALQSTMFLLTTLVVSRDRPEVEQLDPAPPTSSFPSGHTGAATALWLGLALIVATKVRPRGLRVLVVALMMLVPLGVALSRLYRGMHFPGDVTFGMLNGIAAVLIIRRAMAEQAQDAEQEPEAAAAEAPDDVEALTGLPPEDVRG